MALAWVLRDERITSVLIGAARSRNFEDAVGALSRLDFSPRELQQIDEILA